jgi:uncharacterized repeat protein (TIGR03803 family)
MDTQKKIQSARRGLCAVLVVGILGTSAAVAQTYEVVHRFRNSEASARPDEPAASQSRLIVTPGGYLYGTTYWGGTTGFGTIYRMDAAGTTTALHSFAFADGANPVVGLVRASGGAFYGTTNLGGTHNQGTVFRVDSSGDFTRLHSFDGDGGEHPLAELIETRGAFYGTTREGGVSNLGTVFRMGFAGSVTSVHAFAGPDGAYPVATRPLPESLRGLDRTVGGRGSHDRLRQRELLPGQPEHTRANGGVPGEDVPHGERSDGQSLGISMLQ